MNIKREKISESQVSLVISLTKDEIKPFLERGAKKISLKQKIKGFRKGKAPYDVIKGMFGEMGILQESAESIINNFLIDAINKEDIKVVGNPDIEITKMAPDNDFEFTAKIDLMPTVTLDKKWKDFSITVEKHEVKDDDVQNTLDQLLHSRAKEVLKTEKAEKKDKAILDLEVKIDGVVAEDGVAKDLEVVLGKEQMIPGFEDHIIGKKAGEKTNFKLNFPKDYFKKDLAGKEGEFTVEIKKVFAVELPKLDDSFAETFGIKTVKELQETIKRNLESEKQAKELQDKEIELFEKMIDSSQFTEIPAGMIEAELNKMVEEMKQNIASRGLKFEDYLSHMKLTEEKLRENFADDADKRVKSFLVLDTLKNEEKVEATDAEIDEKVKHALDHHAQSEQHKKHFQSAYYRQYIKGVIETQKAAQLLKDTVLKFKK